MKTKLSVTAAVVLLAGCATKSRTLGFTGAWGTLCGELHETNASARDKSQALERLVASNEVPLGGTQMALVHRAQAQLAKNHELPLGSFARRASAADFEALVGPLRERPELLPPALTGAQVVQWQDKLDAAAAKPELYRATADEVIGAVAPLRDALDVVFTVNRDPAAYLADVLKVSPEAGRDAAARLKAARTVLYELVLEADLLVLASAKDPAPAIAFLTRYPDDPYAASALFGLGAVHEAAGQGEEARKRYAQVVAQFPDHPIASEARAKLAAGH